MQAGRKAARAVTSVTAELDDWITSNLVLTPSTNKRLLDEVASVPSKRLRNKISGCA